MIDIYDRGLIQGFKSAREQVRKSAIDKISYEQLLKEMADTIDEFERKAGVK